MSTLREHHPPTPSPTPTWRLWPQGAWALALAGKVELRSFKFSPGQTVSKYSNYTLNIFGWKTSILELKHFKIAALSPGPQSLAFGMFFLCCFFPMLLLLRPLQFSWLPMPSLPFSLFRWKNQQQCPPLALISLFVAILHCAHTIFQTVPHFNIDFQSYMQQVGNKSQLWTELEKKPSLRFIIKIIIIYHL